ncbi:hypothetical protein [Streptomyces albireticuli]
MRSGLLTCPVPARLQRRAGAPRGALEQLKGIAGRLDLAGPG